MKIDYLNKARRSFKGSTTTIIERNCDCLPTLKLLGRRLCSHCCNSVRSVLGTLVAMFMTETENMDGQKRTIKINK